MAPEIVSERARRDVILIVDDDSALRTSLAELLGECGYDTLTESDGVAALDLLDSLPPSSEDQPCVMLVDVMMPVMDGYALAPASRSTGHGVGPGDLDVGPHSTRGAALRPRLRAETLHVRPLDERDSRRRAGETVELQLILALNRRNQGSP